MSPKGRELKHTTNSGFWNFKWNNSELNKEIGLTSVTDFEYFIRYRPSFDFMPQNSNVAAEMNKANLTQKIG